MGDRLQAGKPSRYVTNHPGQLSLAIVGRRYEYQRKLGREQAHRAMHWSVVWQCKTGVWLRAKETEISAALWALWLGKDFTFLRLCCINRLV